MTPIAQARHHKVIGSDSVCDYLDVKNTLRNLLVSPNSVQAGNITIDLLLNAQIIHKRYT